MLKLEPLFKAEKRNITEYGQGLIYYATDQSEQLATAAAKSKKFVTNCYESENCRYTFLDVTGKLVNYKINVSVLQLFFFILIKFAELNPLATDDEKETRLLTRQPITKFSLHLEDFLKTKIRKNINDLKKQIGQDCETLGGLGVTIVSRKRERGTQYFTETTTGRLNFFQYINYDMETDRINIIVSDPYALIMLMDGKAVKLTADFFSATLSESHNSISLLATFLKLANDNKRTETVKELLKSTNLPSLETTKEKYNRDYKNKIIEPFIKALENIDSFSFHFRRKGERQNLRKEELSKINIDEFLELRIYFLRKPGKNKNLIEEQKPDFLTIAATTF